MWICILIRMETITEYTWHMLPILRKAVVRQKFKWSKLSIICEEVIFIPTCLRLTALHNYLISICLSQKQKNRNSRVPDMQTIFTGICMSFLKKEASKVQNTHIPSAATEKTNTKKGVLITS